jgi:hypothetical protein
MDKMLSGEDISSLLKDDVKKIRIVRFSDLYKYKSLQELLPKKNSFIVIFLETESYNRGHWVALFRYNSSFEFYDSYGLTEKQDYSLVPNSTKKELNEKDYLKELFKNNLVIENTKDFQKWDDKISTCGRWVVIRVYLFLKGYDLKHFIRQIDLLMKLYGFKSYDELAVFFTED